MNPFLTTDGDGFSPAGDCYIVYPGKNLMPIETIRLMSMDVEYDVETIVVGMPLNMDGSSTFRVEATNKFIHKLKCKYNKMKIETVDERLTTVQAHKTMNELNINSKKKKNIVDTISAVYILEMYVNKNRKEN